MDYRNIAIIEFENLVKETETYEEAGEKKGLSVGQVFLAVMKRKPTDISLSEWLMNISDEDMYSEIERTKLKERP